MEVQSKNRRFNLKTTRRNQNESLPWFNNSDDRGIRKDDDKFEIYCQKNASTPIRPLKTSNVSPVSQSSPQFRVGWNDGSQNLNICDMRSPVSTVPARRKIRRCPENLISKISPSTIDFKDKNDKERDSCDISQCIKWAKSLMEVTSLQLPCEEETPIADENVTEITKSVKDTSLEIPLDDSSNEMMILCSQAVEESVSAGKLSVENKKSHSEKHQITPNCDRSANKRFKPQINPDNTLSERNVSNSDRKLNSFVRKLNDTPIANNSSINDLKKQTGTCSNNNNVNLRSLNANTANFKTPYTLSQLVKESETFPPRTTSTSTSSDKSSPNLSNDNIKSYLDDEDDVFCSLDFNVLDSISQKVEPSKPVLNPSSTVVKPQVKNFEPSKVVTKTYSKEEIEKRRLEAKKRLLFNKKHRSM